MSRLKHKVKEEMFTTLRKLVNRFLQPVCVQSCRHTAFCNTISSFGLFITSLCVMFALRLFSLKHLKWIYVKVTHTWMQGPSSTLHCEISDQCYLLHASMVLILCLHEILINLVNYKLITNTVKIRTCKGRQMRSTASEKLECMMGTSDVCLLWHYNIQTEKCFTHCASAEITRWLLFCRLSAEAVWSFGKKTHLQFCLYQTVILCFYF